MSTSRLISRALALFAVLSASSCVTRPPTIAHVHVGHALTGVHVTPGQAGYLLVAEERAVAVRDLAQKASADTNLPQIKTDVAAAVAATVSDGSFGLRHSIVQASNHITFAVEATSLPNNPISSQRSTTRTMSRANCGADARMLELASSEVAANVM